MRLPRTVTAPTSLMASHSRWARRATVMLSVIRSYGRSASSGTITPGLMSLGAGHEYALRLCRLSDTHSPSGQSGRFCWPRLACQLSDVGEDDLWHSAMTERKCRSPRATEGCWGLLRDLLISI